MKYKTRGIVFNFVKFRETSIVTRIYTNEFGLKSYIINGVRSNKPRYHISLFQPLTQLDMVVYNKAHASLNRVVEIKCNHPYRSISYNITKESVALFITEILYKIIREEEINPELFSFIETSLIIFDESDQNYMNFHLQFLLKLTRFFGFAPSDSKQMINELKTYSSLHEIRQQDQQIIDKMLEGKYDSDIRINNSQRRILLNLIIKYYQVHFDHLSEIKSIKILGEIFE